MSRVGKVGRNDPCPCGSGMKFKKCCLGKAVPVVEARPELRTVPTFRGLKIAPPELRDRAMHVFQEQRRKEQERLARFGEVRPQISTLWKGHRFIAVRNKLYYSDKWKFFADFLRDHVPHVFGKEWFDAEVAKAEGDRHPLMQWRSEGIRYMNAQQPDAAGVYGAVPNGFLAAYMAFAYDLYIVEDNGGLDDALLARLKHREQFQGARHELFAEATCYRAGFTVQHENERDGTRRHAEFSATHTHTGQVLSVEAKSKHRAGVIAMPGAPQPHEKLNLRFGGLLNDALAKHPPHPLVVFIDTNLPVRAADRLYAPQAVNPLVPSRIFLALVERVRREHGGVDPYALLVFTNHPHHYAATNELDPRKHLLSVQSFQPPAGVAHQGAVLKLHQAAELYGNIPNEFPAM
jgi:SEC-C motif